MYKENKKYSGIKKKKKPNVRCFCKSLLGKHRNIKSFDDNNMSILIVSLLRPPLRHL